MARLRYFDLAVLVVYLCAVVGLGCWFALRKRSSERFMSGGRAIPGWAVGLSMFGSYVSSISFLANPGKSFAGNWNAFVFTLATPLAALVATLWFVPFYRNSGAVSAYEHLEHRFGGWARTYAVICFLLTQMTRTGTVTYLLALTVTELTGWPIEWIILLTGGLMVVYSIFGGIEAVVWIGALQSAVLILGPLICVVALLLALPGGLGSLLTTAQQADKLSLGSFGPSLSESTFWVILAFGLATNLQNFGIDQSYVQRYITTPSVREARKSVWLTTALYVPVSAFFFFIGTALWALHAGRPEMFPADLNAAGKPDTVFPYFIANHLPLGLSGLVVAAIFAASLDSNLSSMATLSLCDLYKRYLRPAAGERESLRVLRLSTIFWAVLSTAAALAMTKARNVLDLWWEWAGIFSGGMLGLFLLGLLSRRAGRRAALAGVTAGIIVIVWLTVSPTTGWPEAGQAYARAAAGGQVDQEGHQGLAGSWASLRSPLHPLLTMVVGTLVILIVGLMVTGIESLAAPRGAPEEKQV